MKKQSACFRSYLFLLFVLLTIQMTYGQNIYNVDSLTKVLYGQTEDSMKLKALKFLTYNYLYSKPDSSKYYNDLMFSISERSKSDLGFYDSHLYKSYLYYTKSNFDSAFIAVNNAISYAERMKDTAKISDLLSRNATLYNRLGKYDSAEVVTRKSLKLALLSKDWRVIASNYGQLGNVFYYNNKFESALKNYVKVDSITSKHGVSVISAGSSINVGNIFVQLKNYPKAKEYYIQAKGFYKQLKMTEGGFHADQKLAELEGLQKNYEKCIELLQPVKAFYANLNDESALANINIVLGESYSQIGNYDAAEAAFVSALSNASNSKSMSMLASALKSSGRTQIKLGKFRPAVNNLLRADELNDEMNITVERGTLLADLAEAYKGLGKFDSAYHYSKLHQQFMDTLASREKYKYTRELEQKYQTEKKEQEIALLSARNALTEEKSANQRNIFVAGGSILTLGLIGLFFLYRNKQKTNTKLRELDTLKSNFFANISHEFRTPLTLISNPIDKKLEDPKISKEERHDFEMAQRNKERLLNLVDQLLDLSKIDAGSMVLRVSKNQIWTLLRSLAEAFDHLALQNGITYAIDIPKNLDEAWFDSEAVSKVVINLLANAVKYTPEGGSVTLRADLKKEGELHLEFSNSAPTLTSEDLNQLFERFYRGTTKTDGTGIGLALVKELILLHKGSLKTTKEGERVQFIVKLPVKKEDYETEQLVETRTPIEIPDLRTTERLEAITVQTNDELPILLIVEDNRDVQQLLGSTFGQHYQIMIASDGEEGMRIATEYIPDLIISDVMMPKKDGIVLTKELKQDERTSHIPIILLTAKAGEENELVGIESGADDYITKPFKSKLLTTKAEKLIALRKELQAKYSQEVILKPQDISVTSADEKFLEKVQRVLNEHLIEPDFNVEKFSKLVNMSRMQLLRKIKGLTGQTASEFIKMERLKLAANLLKTSSITISEVGYSVGFNDHSYFSKCFKESYGVTPTEYAKSS
ncbi:MAG: response regulator [Bacteroidota bacterium]